MESVPHTEGGVPPVTLIFVRHGQTEWNAQSRWQGWLDSPLSEKGREQARGAREKLRDTAIDFVYASSVGRALDTAAIIIEPHGLDVVADDRLRERFYGGYEGLNSAEIEQRFPGSRFSVARDTRSNWRPPDGESMAEVRERVAAFISEATKKHAGQTVLCATHSGTVRAVDSIWSGKPFEEIWHRVPGNCSILIIKAWPDGRFELVRDFYEPVVPTRTTSTAH